MRLLQRCASLVKGQNSLSQRLWKRTLCGKNGDGPNDDKNQKREYIPPGGSYRSPIAILKEELQPVLEGKISGVEAPVPRHTDILIIGGGIMGSAAAYFLKAHAASQLDVTVIERDYGYTRASTMLSAGGLRHQFSLPENVEMSMFTTQFLQNIREHLSVLDQDPPSVSFTHQGYLFLVPEERAELLQSSVEMQRSMGAKTELLTKKKLAERFPWMNLDGVELGSYGMEGEGWFDPWQLMYALKAKNINMGVRYCEGEVKNFRFETIQEFVEDTGKKRQKIRGVDIDHKNGKTYGCNAAMFVNCAGPWAGHIARLAGIGSGDSSTNTVELPVEPRKRYVYVIHAPDGPSLDTPFLVDPSGCYMRREGLGGHYICGASPDSEKEEPDINNMEVDYDFFYNRVWPTLAQRVPSLEKLKLKSAWSGYYDFNTVDQNLIVGRHPYHTNFLFANGSSGHGIQHGLAIGRAICEIIAHNQYQTINLERFEFSRFLNEMPIKEYAIV